MFYTTHGAYSGSGSSCRTWCGSSLWANRPYTQGVMVQIFIIAQTIFLAYTLNLQYQSFRLHPSSRKHLFQDETEESNWCQRLEPIGKHLQIYRYFWKPVGYICSKKQKNGKPTIPNEDTKVKQNYISVHVMVFLFTMLFTSNTFWWSGVSPHSSVTQRNQLNHRTCITDTDYIILPKVDSRSESYITATNPQIIATLWQ